MVAALLLGNGVAEKASIIWLMMWLCAGCAVVDWIARRTPDVEPREEADSNLPKNVIPMRRVR
jgi:hypothetical protein